MYRINDLDTAISAKIAATADPAELERLGKLGQAISSLRAKNIMGIE